MYTVSVEFVSEPISRVKQKRRNMRVHDAVNVYRVSTHETIVIVTLSSELPPPAAKHIGTRDKVQLGPAFSRKSRCSVFARATCAYKLKASGPERTVLNSQAAPSAYNSQGQTICNVLCVRRTSGDHAKRLGACTLAVS